jgi:hypothetical protein
MNNMPVPAEIQSMGKSVHLCGTFRRTFANPWPSEGRRLLERDFQVYLEVGMQAKHDGLMREYCIANKLGGRRAQESQVAHEAGTTMEQALAADGFYAKKARIAAEIVLTQMSRKWKAQPQGPGPAVFTLGKRVDASVQGDKQPDGYQYEISYWYDSQYIYVLFHCYPEKKR